MRTRSTQFIKNINVYYCAMSVWNLLLGNFTLVLVPQQLNAGVRLLSEVAGGLIVSAGNPLDFHDET